MNTKPINNTGLNIKILTTFVLVLVLWAGFAFIDHQLDINEHHHTQHQCQLFSSIINGASSTVPTLPLIIQKPVNEDNYSLTSIYKSIPVRKARAPPEHSVYY